MVESTLHARRLSRTPPLAGLVTGAELAPGPAISDDDTAALARSIRGRAGSYHHPVGTCAMGPNPGHGAVIDARGAVHGTAQREPRSITRPDLSRFRQPFRTPAVPAQSRPNTGFGSRSQPETALPSCASC